MNMSKMGSESDVPRKVRRLATLQVGILVIALVLTGALLLQTQPLLRRLESLRKQIAEDSARIGELNETIAAKERRIAEIDSAQAVWAERLPLVYINYGRTMSPTIFKELRLRLNQNLLPAPGASPVSETESRGVRYFYKDDEAVARRAATFIEEFLRGKGCQPFAMPVTRYSNPRGDARQGQIEAYIISNYRA